MAKSKTLDKSISDRAVWWGGCSLLLTTIYFNSRAQDPFNSPKFWVIMLGASWLVGFLVVYLRANEEKSNSVVNRTKLLIFLFISFSTFSIFFAKNRFIALFGENMRKNGFLTYLSLAAIFLATLFFVKNSNLFVIYRFMLLSGFVVGGYGLLQMSGNDFVGWTSSGMALFSTLGNSNFAGSAMAIIAIITLGGGYIYRKSILWSSLSLLSFVILVVTIFPTNARQGLILLVFGITSLSLVLVYNKSKFFGQIGLGIFSTGSIFAVLGMLQIGPLERFLYKDSVSVRGYYWRAGIEMFKDNIFFGVGLDNYGSFFKMYREVGYPLKYGYSLTSTNAHNVFIQHFATGGIFVGIIYLLLTFYILFQGVKALRKFEGDKRFTFAVFFIAWLAFQAQSLISIDNIGISIWGWVLGGIVIALSVDDNQNLESNSGQKVKKGVSSINLLQPTFSAIVSVVTLVLVVILYRAESAIFQQRASYNPAAPAQKEIFLSLSNKTISAPLIDLQYKVMTATFLHGMGYKQDAISLLEKLYKEDPYNLDGITFLASYYEMSGQVQKSIKMREVISDLDPWNANNYLQMAFNYKYLKDETNQKIYLDKALAFAATDPSVIKAKSELEQ